MHIKYSDYWKQSQHQARALYLAHSKRHISDLLWLEKVPSFVFRGDVTLEYWRTHILSRFANQLVKLGITANQITICAILIAGCAVFTSSHMLLVALITLNLLLDGLDGVVARIRGEDSLFGAWFDIIADTFASLIFVFVTFTAAGVSSNIVTVLLVIYPAQVYLSARKNAVFFSKPLSIGFRVFSSGFSVIVITATAFFSGESQLIADMTTAVTFALIALTTINIGLLIGVTNIFRIRIID